MVVPGGRARRRVRAVVTTVAVCWKWVRAANGRPGGISPADEAALELALTFADANSEVVVRAVSCGDSDSVTGLRQALAAGADEAIHVDGNPARRQHRRRRGAGGRHRRLQRRDLR